jgi:aspartyl-tRNA(Asn)/glutamyl-tRNA(Gln) amidotransferase subunit C
MPSLTPDEVAHLARLSRMALSADELDHLGRQLEVILGAVASVGLVAAADVPPTTHAVPVVNVFRPDVLAPSLTQAEALSGAPAAEDGRFRVPRILEDEQ